LMYVGHEGEKFHELSYLKDYIIMKDNFIYI